MNILVYLGHPAHFHLFKNSINNWKNEGHHVTILIKKKDVLENLLQSAGFNYINILKKGRKDSKIGMFWGMIQRAYQLFKICRKHKPDILTGTCVENSFAGKLLKIPVINLNEDDAEVVPLYAKLSYPWANVILAPEVCNCGKWNTKAVKYKSYHELAYLHPNHFVPDKEVVEKYFSVEKPYFILRLAKLTAHHDDGIQGMNASIVENIIQILQPHGDIYITAERELEAQFEPYRINISPLDMHHIMAFAQLYIGDSQTMAAEAGVLGVPFIRFNDFVGRIGYLEELENVYHLGFGIKTTEEEKLYQTVTDLVKMSDRKNLFSARRQTMLAEKIDLAKFLTWFIQNYSLSSHVMKDNPDYQNNFR